MFNAQISLYCGVTDKTGVTIPLIKFLKSRRHIEDIERLRASTDAEERKQIKLSLPQATISGVFKPQRKAECLKAHSGFICVDFDAKDNPCVTDWEEAKAELSRLPEVAYCSLSVSGNGVFAIIPLAYPQMHKAQFKQLSIDLKKATGLIADSACSDVTRLRCLSYDEHRLIKETIVPYKGVYIEPQRPIVCNYDFDSDATIDKVMRCCREIEFYNVDITNDYDNWTQVGASLASLGEMGRDAFHICSRQNIKYNSVECDKKFDNAIQTFHKINIGTFFLICKRKGISITENRCKYED